LSFFTTPYLSSSMHTARHPQSLSVVLPIARCRHHRIKSVRWQYSGPERTGQNGPRLPGIAMTIRLLTARGGVDRFAAPAGRCPLPRGKRASGCQATRRDGERLVTLWRGAEYFLTAVRTSHSVPMTFPTPTQREMRLCDCLANLDRHCNCGCSTRSGGRCHTLDGAAAR
jgi:hypothetical protein